jgi:hypothetical protein
MSVKRTMREIDSHEFSEWMAYWLIEPFGPEREDMRHGVVAATIANVNRDPKAVPEPFDASDFFPRLSAVRSLEDSDDNEVIVAAGPTLEDKIRGWAARMGAQKAKEPRG